MKYQGFHSTEDARSHADFENDAKDTEKLEPKKLAKTKRQGNIGVIWTKQQVPDDAILQENNIVEAGGKHPHLLASGKIYSFDRDCTVNGKKMHVWKWLEVEHATTLRHSQHGDIPLQAGVWAVKREMQIEKQNVRERIKATLQGIQDAQLESQRLSYSRE
ncbi:MAG: hypothetical protein WBF38_02740 [Nitrosotalea sp.]